MNMLRAINIDIKKCVDRTRHRSSNLKKYLSSNPIKRYLINRFLTGIIEAVETCKARKVIEIGCGEGILLKCLTLNTDSSAYGCDINEGSVRFASSLNPDVRLFMTDVNSLSIEDGAYDLVVCCEVLEHLSAPYTALQEIKRVSSKYCVISVPYEPYFSLLNFLSGKNISAFGNDPGHIQKWTKNTFKEMLSEEFEIISLRSSMPWLIALCSIDTE